MARAELIVNGIPYLPVKVAARAADLAPDYVSKLCRTGFIDAQREENGWYVNEESLKSFVAEQARQKEAWKQEQARRRKQEQIEAGYYDRVASDAPALDQSHSAVTTSAPAELHAHVQTAKRARSASRVFATSILAVAFLFSSALAFEMIAPPGSVHRAQLASAIGASQIAAAASSNILDSVGDFFSNLFHHPATPTITARGGTQLPPQSPIATSSITYQYVTSNPVVERVIERASSAPSGVSEATLASRLAQLADTLRNEFSRELVATNQTLSPSAVPQQVAAGGTTIVYSSSPASERIDKLTNTAITNPSISGGTITDTTIGVGSLSGTVGIANGGTATSTAPSYGKLLVGNSGGTFDYLATSSLGIVSSGGTSNFGKAFEISGSYLAPTTTLTVLFPAGFIASASSTIANLSIANSTTTNATSTNFAATTASTTNLTTGSLTIGTLTGSLQAIAGVVSATSTLAPVYGGTGQSSFSIGDLLYASAAGTLSKLSIGSTGQVLKVSGGIPGWGADLTGSGGGSSAWATTTDNLALSPADTSQVVLVGASATTTTSNIFEVKGNSLFRGTATAYNTVTAPSFTATSTTVASQLPYASSTAISATYASSTSGVFGNLSIGGLSGFLKATAGAISVAFVDLASNVTGTLPIANGGTGATTFSYGLVLSPGGTTAITNIATSSLGLLTTNVAEGTNQYWTNARFDTRLSATTSLANITTLANLSLPATQLTSFGVPFYSFFSGTTTDALTQGSTNKYYADSLVQSFVHASTTIAKTYAANTFTALQTFGNASTTNISASYASSTSAFFGSLSVGSLTGFLKATAGAITSALVDLASNVTGILPVGNGGTGWASIASAAIPYGNGSGAIATTSAGTPGYVLALLNGVPTWAATSTLSTISGTLAAGGGGTGIANPSAAGVLLGSYAGGAWQQLATSSLNINTDNLVQGASNLFFANSLVQSFIHSSSTIPKTYSDNTFTGSNIFSGSLSALGTSQFANSSNFFGLTSFGATGTTTISTAGTITTPSIIATAATSTSQFANTGAFSIASFGATATSTFSSSGALSLAGGLTLSGSPNGPLDARNGVVGATTSIGILYGGTGATTASQARLNLAAAASGANSDITSLTALTTALTVAQGGTGWATINSGSLLYGNGSSALATTTQGTAGQVLALLNGVPTWAATTTLSTISGTLSGTQLDGVFGSNGILARTTTGTYASRTITGTSNQITVTNGDGASGNPTISLPSLLVFTQASSTQQSIFNKAYFGATATSSFDSTGVLTLTNLNGPLDARNGLVGATTSIGVLYGGTGLTSAPTYGQMLVGNSSGGYTLTATSSLGLGSSGSGGGQLLAVYATSTPGNNVSVNFNGASGSAPSFSAGVLTLPSNASTVIVEGWGSGAGGGSSGGNSGVSGNNGSAGNNTTFGNGTGSGLATSTANGGSVGLGGYDTTTNMGQAGGAGGAASSGDVNVTGGAGGQGVASVSTAASPGGSGGSAPGGGGGGAGARAGAGTAGAAFGGGGGGGGSGAVAGSGSGGGAAGYFRKLITSPSGTYYYNVGAGGAGGTSGGTNSNAGGAGGPGGLVISVYTTGISNGSLASGTAGQFAFYNAAGTNLSATSSIFVDTTTSRIGIGTTTPGSLFSINNIANFQTGTSTIYENLNVQGQLKVGTGSIYLNGSATSTFSAGLQTSALNITSTTATSTFANGIQLSGGCVLVGGSCLGSGSGSVGSGTQGQFAFYNVTGTSLAATSTLTLLQSGLLGIGTTTPTAKLTVYGDIFAEGSNRYLNFGTTQGTSGYGFRDNSGTLEFKNSGGTWQGVTTATSGPSFSVHKNGTSQTVSADTWTKLTWSTETFDTNNNFSSDRFTPTVPGKYLITSSVQCSGNSGVCATAIYKNGGVAAENVTAPIGSQEANVILLLDMNGSTDYVEAYGHVGGGTTVLGGAGVTFFQGALIAPVNATAGGWQNDGTQSFLADSTDLVGIGTSTPWAKLAINPLAGDANQFVVGSSTRTSFLINPAGNVGIGTTSPLAGVMLTVGSLGTGNVSAHSYQARRSAGVSGLPDIYGQSGGLVLGDLVTPSTQLILNLSNIALTGGNVGIGTTTPDAALHVYGGGLHLTNWSNPGANLSAGGLEMGYTGGASVLQSYNRTTTAYAPLRNLASYFTVEPNGSEMMRVNATGVGIGTTTPSQKLDVRGNINIDNSDPYLIWYENDQAADAKRWDALSSGSTLTFRAVNDAYSSANNWLTVTRSGTTIGNISFPNGNVGIATTTPAESLTVNGAVQFGNGNISAAANNYNSGRVGTYASAYEFIQPAKNHELHVWSSDSHDVAIFGKVNSPADTTTYLAGNVGIGTTSPAALFSVGGNAYVSGFLGIGVASPAAKMQMNFDSSAIEGFMIRSTNSSTAGRPAVFINSAGTEIGSISYGGGQTSVAYNTTSDRRMKENIATTTLSLDTLMQLPVRDFSFINDPTQTKMTGFIAQELFDVFPFAVSTNGDNGIDPLGASSTPWGVDYGRITPLLAKSIQELNLKLEELATTTSELGDASFTIRFFSSLFTRLTQWFASATNGITDLFAKVGNFGRVNTDELCTKTSDGTEVCASGDQLAAILAGTAAGAPNAGGASGAPSGPSVPELTNADTATSTTPTDETEQLTPTSTPEISAPESTPAGTGAEEVSPPTPEPTLPEPTKDNPPPLEPTGTITP